MNRSTIEYYTSVVTVQSAQCQGVREAVFGDAPDDQTRLREILALLDGTVVLERDTSSWLINGIRGHYGGEGYALDVSSDEEAAFWLELHRRYPDRAPLCRTAADALLMSNRGDFSQALRLFITAFELDPAQVYKVGGEVSEALQESELAPEYWTAVGRTVLAEQGPAALAEWLAELREDLGVSNPDGVRRIEQALARGE